MHISVWKPLSLCVASILEKKPKKKTGLDHSQDEITPNPSKSQQHELTEALDRASEDLSSENASMAADQTFESENSIPDRNEAFSKFLIMYPKYRSSEKIDRIRSDEYSHLSDHVPKVCLDYCGFGLFSFLQTVHYWESSTFSLTEITTNLSNHVLYGGPEKGTIENDLKTKIMEYLNVPVDEYGLVFTVSRGSAFKLLAESYPFETNKKLLTVFDHESQSVNWMAQRAKEKGATVQTAWFKWPTLGLGSTDLRKQITSKKRKKKDSANGLFVFPVQSRVTGSKYSYQWMSLARQNNWHVLLDAGSLGPKDMDSLGLSLFRPDFIITSFFRVFGFDPSGFGCLLIKKSAIGSLRSQSGHAGSGIVKIGPVFPMYLSDSVDGTAVEDKQVSSENRPGPRRPAFSGAYSSAQVREVFDTEMEADFDENGSFSAGEMMKSPVFSEDGSSENSLWIDLGRSPMGSDDGKHHGSALPPPVWFSGKTRNGPNSSPEATPNGPNEGAIQRETEGEFRLLGNRERNGFSGGGFEIEEHHEITENVEEDDYDTQESVRQEPEISCRHLDQVNMLGLNKTALRLRFLVNWLVNSLLQLRIPGPNGLENGPLVQIYGPKIKYERGSSVAFNLRDKNKRLIDPEVIQKLAETNGISLGIGILSHIRVPDGGRKAAGGGRPIRVEVVTASLGFLSNFSDVYNLWAFVAKFLNPGFINGGLSTVVEE